jgi:leucyl-tRNA synthetase
VVEARKMEQWFFRITAYADALLRDHALLDWPERTITIQRNWIGRSEGAELLFRIDELDIDLPVFTTRPDTVFGATFFVLAPEHPLVDTMVERSVSGDEIDRYVRTALAKRGEERAAAEEKTGVFTGFFATNPATDEPIPVWVADYVLMEYGTGAIMAVPGHDERDREFAERFELPVREVVDEEQGLLVESAQFSGVPVAEARPAIVEWLSERGRGRPAVSFRLRDWGFSRQRYWGCPIPVIYCPKCEAVPVPEDQLPVVLPEDVAFSGVQSPIKADPEWRKCVCPQCGGPAERETDTFDTFMESSWYYARYTSPGANAQIDERANYWLPVDQYVGGIEHAIMHLLYFRFYHKLLRDAGMVHSDEPARNLLCQGMVIAETFYRDNADGSKDWINPSAVEILRDDKARVIGATLKADGQPVHIGGTEKMSKSKNNGIDPQTMVDKYGADTVRLFSMFAAPPEQSLEWSEAGVEGMARFLKRLWREVTTHAASPDHPVTDPSVLDAGQKTLRRQLHETIQKVSDDFGRRHAFNTAIAALMELLNALSKFGDQSEQGRAVRHEALEAMVLLLNPVVPHISHALWQVLGHAETVLEDQPWPKADPAALVRDSVTLAVQINGKLRATIELAANASKEEAEAAARALPQVAHFLEGMSVRKVIVVPGKIVNIVAG